MSRRLSSRTSISAAAWVGLAMLTTIVLVGLFGRYVASYEPDEMFGAPFSAPSGDHPLGLDFAGRDVLSRFLYGGQTAIVVALTGTVMGFLLGSCLGLISAYRRGWVDELIGRSTDLALAFPALILSLLLLAAFGTSLGLVVFAITITTAPGVARIARAATLEVVDLPYVESARARGERSTYVMAVEILPSVRSPLLVDFGLRLTTAILLVAALSFVGLGLQPPAADWGLMIGENRIGLNVQPWPVIVPAAAIAALTIGVNLIIDGVGRRSGSIRNRSNPVSEAAGLSVDGLRVAADGIDVEIVSDISFAVPPGATLGIVGESGCGKTTVAMALLGFARPGTSIRSGSVVVAGRDLLALGEKDLRRSRGRVISYVPQNPARALSPGMTVGRQLEEMLDSDTSASEREAALRSAWEGAQLPFDPEMLGRYPHQLSGGQQQRVAIAMALVCEPAVIVMDEPTTGLDVLTQDRLIEVIIGLREQRTVSIVYVSHDLGVIRNVVDAVAVMYGGRVVETGPVDEIFRDPAHPYTRRLLEAIPRVRSETRHLRGIPGSAVEPWDRPPGCPFAPRCDMRIERCDLEMPPSEIAHGSAARRVSCWRAGESAGVSHLRAVPPAPPAQPATAAASALLVVTDLVAAYRGKRLGIGKGRQPNVALRGVTFALPAGSCLAVVGESGSGKTTLGRCLAGLHRPLSGGVLFAGQPLAALAQDRPPEVRRRIQLVFQDPDSSLNPHMSIGRIVRRPLRQFFDLSHDDEAARVSQLLEQVHLPPSVRDRMPRELSGGEKQRVAIARALAADPELLICDEVTSALDVAVQASILELLAELRRARDLSMLFISHDLAVVKSISDHVLVLRDGEIVEHAERDDLFDAPGAAYSRELLDAVPDLRAGDYPAWDEPSDTPRVLGNHQA